MIIFAFMNGCGFCDKAKKHLANEIDQGKVKVVEATEAKKHGMNGNGFPQFKSTITNKTSMGFKDKDKLMKDLGHSDDSKSVDNNGKVKFYHMKGCGFCSRAMDMLKPLIDQGHIEVLSHDKAPANVRGFPHFEGPKGEHSGLPKSPEELMNKVGGVHVENFQTTHYREYFMHTGNTPGI